MAFGPPSAALSEDVSPNTPRTRFEGQFIPPRVSTRHMPIAIGGRGSLEVVADELVLRGTKISTSNTGMVLLFFAGFAAIVALAGWLDLGEGSFKYLVIGATGLFIAFAAKARKKKTPTGPELEIRIPLDKIKELKTEGADINGGEITILIKKNKPKGMIHFYPEGSIQEVSEAVKRAVHPRVLKGN